MSSNKEEKTESPFDSEGEDETIALSMDELDNILSEAEIVQEQSEKKKSEEEKVTIDQSPKTKGEEASEVSIEKKVSSDETAESETEPLSELTDMEEFDISNEIEELSPEDLEAIELDEDGIDIEQEDTGEDFEEDMETEESGEESLEEDYEKELADIDTQDIALEANIDEEMDLDSYLDSVKEDIDLESLDLDEEGIEEKGEEEDEGILESPVLGETDAEIELEAEKAFREAGIEGIEEEAEPIGEEDILSEEPQTGAPGEEGEPQEAGTEIGGEGPLPTESVPTDEEIEKLDEEIMLTEEEEKILNEDLDLEAETMEEAEQEIEELDTEDVVAVTGEELNEIMGEQASVEVPFSGEPGPTSEQGEPTIDKQLLNNITEVLKYMDSLLGDLPEEKIEEFTKSDYFSLYKDIFEKLGIHS